MSNCRCQGHYTDCWTRWRVLERNPGGASKLYCLDCRWEWLSKAKYVALLPGHTKSDRTGMNDADVLDLIQRNFLIINPKTAVVTNRRGKRLKITHRTHRDGPQRGTYRFVNVCSGNKKKKVALHRLVWMAAHRSLIPDGFDIDHVKDQQDDTIGNLRLLDSSLNRSLGAQKSIANRESEAPF